MERAGSIPFDVNQIELRQRARTRVDPCIGWNRAHIYVIARE